MKYLLDTDMCIYFLNGDKGVVDKMKQISPDLLNITLLTVSELFYGAYSSANVENNIDKVTKFCQWLNLLEANMKSANIFGRIKSELRKEGKLIEDFDIAIASISLAENLTLVSGNISHFSRIRDLKLQNWSE